MVLASREAELMRWKVEKRKKVAESRCEREREEQTGEKTRRFKERARDEEYARAKTERYEQSAKKKLRPANDD
ncbi:uncharacterized protein ARB_07930 [Trichophyton benhamiae CBS 112371]|uniref:Uncharacterized protein n=1 Tax=Arthroderma benhamiae (strain ATCC MYA-4681 / CBS 112371) TaxID=663331 RepID=D4AUL3_ARTBC|nr:uncharacterized protein ARB_07930 [Trichophyton benhamiae CBS 112371]EFE33178.1 hypothetical protein ARB_07930 [Trichophyton benhamiae CBS 112371]